MALSYSGSIYIYWSDDRLKRSLNYSWNAESPPHKLQLPFTETRHKFWLYTTEPLVAYKSLSMGYIETDGGIRFLSLHLVWGHFSKLLSWLVHPITAWSNLFYQVGLTETVPMMAQYVFEQMRTLMGLSLTYCLSLIKANSSGLPYWVRPAVINVKNKADLRMVTRRGTRRHESDVNLLRRRQSYEY